MSRLVLAAPVGLHPMADFTKVHYKPTTRTSYRASLWEVRVINLTVADPMADFTKRMRENARFRMLLKLFLAMGLDSHGR